MRLSSYSVIASALLLTCAAQASGNPRIHRGPTSPRLFKSHTKASKPVAATRVISSERATQIQTALISAGYMTGTPSGNWDETTQAAMVKLQADNGWQTKLVPDSRAIIKLGLGPAATSAAAATADSLGAPAPNASEDLSTPASNQ